MLTYTQSVARMALPGDSNKQQGMGATRHGRRPVGRPIKNPRDPNDESLNDEERRRIKRCRATFSVHRHASPAHLSSGQALDC